MIYLIEIIGRMKEIIIIKLIKYNQYSEQRKNILYITINIKLQKYAHL